ncbi:hypothetical protein AMIS_48240 [Actinoplanes missouriensis 431]|uniref:Uncharacterized protein n=1 Tax=Actinoplanes missouriensis (strain ATCC 14538 / DSM 43046 / CBS 188.64 / JCM 3121 / NBRC 102363 / NCIMB 12654 / NRRL B-3342 / UNCC 431) TaxID=512565 RepID=I0HAK7_ACTM4|nr:hypothetical protein [Actinoplanes missouriensis]BAL90044.1 hypothetical protein AMIS_48240 [Actinoplanes missouriensis 431]
MSDRTPPEKPGKELVLRREPDVPAMLLADKRSWREYAAPGLVIFLGVLAVIAFGLVVVTRGGDEPQPAGTAPALGGLGDPNAAQLPIPLQSPSPSPSFAPVDTIAIERSAVPERVNLTAEGTIDWVHWGEQGTYALERNANGGFAILEGTPGPSRARHTLSPEKYRWTGGSPLASASGVTSGVRACDAGSGFTLSAPAGTRDSTLRLYVGLVSGSGSLEVKLSTGGKVVRDRWEQTGTSMETAVYTVSYTATGTGKISLKWITDESFSEDCGGVALQAATLS